MARRLKAAELFLSLGMIASLATACGGPTEGGDAVESDGETMEAPADETENAPMEEASPEEAPMEEESSEGGEGGEG